MSIRAKREISVLKEVSKIRDMQLARAQHKLASARQAELDSDNLLRKKKATLESNLLEWRKSNETSSLALELLAAWGNQACISDAERTQLGIEAVRKRKNVHTALDELAKAQGRVSAAHELLRDKRKEMNIARERTAQSGTEDRVTFLNCYGSGS